MSILRIALISGVLFITAGYPLYAQTPPNDDCGGLIHLGTAPVCPPTTFSNIGATASNIGADNEPGCLGTAPQRDVWFSFDCAPGITEFVIRINGTGPAALKNPQITVYDGDCLFNGLFPVACAVASPGQSGTVLEISALTPGKTYFLRITDYSLDVNPNQGDFTICIDPAPPPLTVDQGGSTQSSGTLLDGGGATGNYGNGEKHVFTICPTPPVACIEFNLEYYRLEAYHDSLVFFDGKWPTGDTIAVLRGAGSKASLQNGQYEGSGGVCFGVQAQSGCLSVIFSSNITGNYEGWKGKWTSSPTPCASEAAISTAVLPPPDTIVDYIKTPFTEVSLAAVKCPPGAYATFRFPDDQNDVGLQRGLLLTSGRADFLNFAAKNVISNNNAAPGDADLDLLASIPNSMDACIIEADVFAAADELRFEYTFASEEYPEYVKNIYNDIFAFLISGPGISGHPLLPGKDNIAVLPNTNTPVEINAVNDLYNWQYYRNNALNPRLAYDGLTADSMGRKKSLTARSRVIPCNTYRLKFAVADRGDRAYDSGVFISKIQAGGARIIPQFASGLNYLIENCGAGQDQFVIRLPEPKQDTARFTLQLSGQAQEGVDFTAHFTNPLVFLPGQTEIIIPVKVLGDQLQEGAESLTLSLSVDYGCGQPVVESLTLEIRDAVEISLNVPDSIQICQGADLPVLAQGAVNYFWQPAGLADNPFLPNPVLKPGADTTFTVVGNVGGCKDTASVYIDLIQPEIRIAVPGNDSTLCLGENILLQAVTDTPNFPITWEPPVGLSQTSGPTTTATPVKTFTWKVNLLVPGCPAEDLIVLKVDTLFPPAVTPSFDICRFQSVQLAPPTFSSSHYIWSPDKWLDNSNIPGATATPDSSVVYTLTTTSANGYCTSTATSAVTVRQAVVDISGNSTVELCRGDTLLVSAAAQPPGATVLWSPATVLNSPTGASVYAFPQQDLILSAIYQINNCEARDSIFIKVNTPPLLDLTKTTALCLGDSVLLNAQFDPGSTYLWTPVPPGYTADFPMPRVHPTDDIQYTVKATSAEGCVQEKSVALDVIHPNVDLGSDREICPGEAVVIKASVSDTPSMLVWSPNVQGSPLELTEFPTVDTFYALTAIYPAGCKATDTVWVNLFPAVSIDSFSVTPANLCAGFPVKLKYRIKPDGAEAVWFENGSALSETGDSVARYPSISEGSLFYELKVKSAEGCIVQEGPIEAVVARCVIVPNAFTPGNDEINSVFQPVFLNENIDLLWFQVFDRWGRKVFDAVPSGQKAWDGADAPSDVYTYRIRIRYPDGVEKDFSGDITLLK